MPYAHPSWSGEDAIRLLSDSGQDLLPVAAADGTFAGIVTTTHLLRLDEILDAGEDPTPT